VTMKNIVFWDTNNPVRTSQETHYVSATEPNRLMLFERFTAVTMKNIVFWDTKNPVRTSQETLYVSATEPSRLMLFTNSGFHGCDYENFRLLGYKTPVHTSQETLSPLQSPAG
jgi:hypothetical protein